MVAAPAAKRIQRRAAIDVGQAFQPDPRWLMRGSRPVSSLKSWQPTIWGTAAKLRQRWRPGVSSSRAGGFFSALAPGRPEQVTTAFLPASIQSFDRIPWRAPRGKVLPTRHRFAAYRDRKSVV